MSNKGNYYCVAPGCDKTAADGRLRWCGRCRLARYHSAECQKRHWPQHKLACRDHRIVAGDEVSSAVLRSELSKWSAKHRLSIAEAALCLLDLPNNPNAHTQNAFELLLKRLPDPALPVTERFEIIKAHLVPAANQPDTREDYKELFAELQSENRQVRRVSNARLGGTASGMPIEVGGVMLLMETVDYGPTRWRFSSTHFTPFSAYRAALGRVPGWEDRLRSEIRTGVMLRDEWEAALQQVAADPRERMRMERVFHTYSIPFEQVATVTAHPRGLDMRQVLDDDEYEHNLAQRGEVAV